VRASDHVKALGARHSFSAVADTHGDHVLLDALPARFELDATAHTLTVSAGMRYAELAARLNTHGFALANLASLTQISVAGACATGTHGSGITNQSLAAAVVAMELITPDGDVLALTSDDPDFAGAVVSRGQLGIVTALTLRIQPAFDMRQRVYEHLPLTMLRDSFDAVMGAAYSVSLFWDWRTDRINQVWVKRRTSDAYDWRFGGVPAQSMLHPIAALPAEPCTEQGDAPGPWHERLPHFKATHQPSSGEELQTEYFVARSDAVAAINALLPLREQISAVIQIAEIRTIAADSLWLSPCFERDSVALHFTWQKRVDEVMTLLPRLESALAPFAARPHWGKLHTLSQMKLAALYPRWGDFERVRQRLDPAGKCR
jgi:xylitol oxidase